VSYFLVSFSASSSFSNPGWQALSIVALTALWALSASALAEPPISDDERFTLLVAPVEATADGGAHATVEQVAEATMQRFRSLWSDQDYGDGLASASDEAIALRLRAAETAAFYRRAPWILARLYAVLAEADSRELARNRSYRELFDAYLAAFRFDDALALRERYPEVNLPHVPEVVAHSADLDAGQRLIWHIDGPSQRMQAAAVSLDDPRLFIVTSPGCGFCRQAAEALVDDEILGPLMHEHALWVAKPGPNNSFHAIAQWNDRYAESPTVLIDDPEQWPFLDFNSTPRFVFFDGKEVKKQLIGWQGRADGLRAIADEFAVLGLLDAASIPDYTFTQADKPTGRLDCPERPEAFDRLVAWAPINSREDLEAHLADIDHGAESPLMNLSEQARKRLANSMYFGNGRVMGFRTDDMMEQLGPEEIYEASSLFGLQYFYAGSFFPLELLKEAELDLRARLHCSGDYGIER
jgi:hypothetical protein